MEPDIRGIGGGDLVGAGREDGTSTGTSTGRGVNHSGVSVCRLICTPTRFLATSMLFFSSLARRVGLWVVGREDIRVWEE